MARMTVITKYRIEHRVRLLEACNEFLRQQPQEQELCHREVAMLIEKNEAWLVTLKRKLKSFQEPILELDDDVYE